MPTDPVNRNLVYVFDISGGDPALLDDETTVRTCLSQVVDRAGLKTQTLPLRVELAGTWSRGRTIVDRRDWSGDMAHDPHGEAPVRVDVALEVDGPRYTRLWADTILGRAGQR